MKRRLSRTHRAAIARGLRRYWRQVRARKAKRRRQAKTRRELKKQQAQIKGRRRVAHEEWEITIRYKKGTRKFVGITVRVIAPAGTTRDVAMLVAKRAGQGHPESGFTVKWNNWQKGLRGYERQYDGSDGLDAPGFAALFHSADVRAERVREDE